MAELRKNPFKNDWVMIASHRQGRPQMPKDWCPFCPGSGKVPDDFEVFKYDNDFPALSSTPPDPDDVANDFFKAVPSYGKCEVILYSKEHTITLPELSIPHVQKLVALWQQRYKELSKDENIKYIYIFENRGELVGVTMPHPHGQIYGYSYVPKKIADELENCKNYFEDTGNCLVCTWLNAELAFEERVIFQGEHFACILPFFTETVFGVQIVAKKHIHNIAQFDQEQSKELAQFVRNTVGMLDALFDEPMPYMMCMHQTPINGDNADDYYHFHIEFVPLLRSKGRQQFFAGSETGAGAHCNPTAPEETAITLKQAYNKFINSKKD